MRGVPSFPADRPPEWLFVRLDQDAETEKRKQLLRFVESFLPCLNWRSHIVVIQDDRTGETDALNALIDASATFIDRHRFAHVAIHPMVYLHRGDEPNGDRFRHLLATVGRFQREAYVDQGESRLSIFPILVPGDGVTVEMTMETARFLNSELASPAVYIGGDLSGESGWAALSSVGRLLLGVEDPVQEKPGLLKVLWGSHVLESVLEKVHRGTGDLLEPCGSHVVIDEFLGGLFTCFEQWERLSPVRTVWDNLSASLPLDCEVSAGRCPACIHRAVTAMTGELVANRRSEEGRRVCFGLGVAFSKREEYLRASVMARCAYDMSATDRDRVAALIHMALCHLALGELEESEGALVKAALMTDDPGLIAYHRGRVQFAWRDWIEALDRFEEALAEPSDEVPEADLHFHMALSHVNLEEYAEARPHLDLSGGEGREAPVRFYHGVCDLNEGIVDRALSRFRESLAIGPADEDLGRVRFYIASCFKELGRYDEAIEELLRAVEDDPGDLANHNLLGFCRYKTGRYEEAVVSFRKALEIDPRSGIDWANLGSNLQRLGRLPEAAEAYRKALSLDPGIAFARERLAGLDA